MNSTKYTGKRSVSHDADKPPEAIRVVYTPRRDEAGHKITVYEKGGEAPGYAGPGVFVCKVKNGEGTHSPPHGNVMSLPHGWVPPDFLGPAAVNGDAGHLQARPHVLQKPAALA